jgi:nucleotide-binding universal stress UspA family protein
MMFKNILLAYDGSDHSQRAARIAGDLARQQTKAELWLVCAVEPIPPDVGVSNMDQLIVERTKARKILLKQAREVVGKGIPIHEELLFGSPAEIIMEIAEVRKCDLIIMGTRGLGGLRGLLLGSQIQKVISLSKCPVLAVK